MAFWRRSPEAKPERASLATASGPGAGHSPANGGGFREFFDAVSAHYPDRAATGEVQYIGKMADLEASGPAERFVKSTTRPWSSTMPQGYPWLGEVSRPKAHALTYKGLINAKTPFDLSLYTRLLWELQPRTVLEFGSFHGGSGVWFADHTGILCREPGDVHSFDVHPKSVSKAAQHPRLHFHYVDITDVKTLDTSLLERLPHPWLIVEDAHENTIGFVLFINKFMESGDYIVIEDVPALATIDIALGFKTLDEAGFLVDKNYCDAYGKNMTCAPNAWLRKS